MTIVTKLITQHVAKRRDPDGGRLIQVAKQQVRALWGLTQSQPQRQQMQP